MKIYQLCQKVKGKDVVINEAKTDKHFRYAIKIKPKYFIKVINKRK